MTTITKFSRYKDNLSIINENGETYVQSYSSRVAKVEGPFLRQLGWWSTTTQKHINYAASQLGLELIRK
jgi:hypothetical protein